MNSVPASSSACQLGRLRTNNLTVPVHAERLVHKLVPTTAEQRRAIELTRTLIWWFYADLKAWKRDPCPRRAAGPCCANRLAGTRRAGLAAA